MSSEHGNLANPEYEPTDEELQELTRSAFADVAAKNAEALRRVHAGIAQSRARLMLQLEAFAPKEHAESSK